MPVEHFIPDPGPRVYAVVFSDLRRTYKAERATLEEARAAADVVRTQVAGILCLVIMGPACELIERWELSWCRVDAEVAA
jgi:hypothetical protein